MDGEAGWWTTSGNIGLPATAIVRVGGMSWLKPGATVLLMLYSAVFVEGLVLNPFCVVMFGMFCVMYGRITFSSVFAITDRRDKAASQSTTTYCYHRL